MNGKKIIAFILTALLLCGCGQVKDPQQTVPPVVTPTTAPATEPTTEPTTVPTTAPVETEPEESLQIGYYVLTKMKMDGITLTGPSVESFKSYLQIREGGEGTMFMMGMGADFTWDEEFISMYDVPEAYSVDNGVVTVGSDESSIMEFTFCGDTLPEGYESTIPAGYYAVSSIGKDGNVQFFGNIDPENGWLEMREDGTGVLYLGGAEQAVSINGTTLTGEDLSIPFMYTDQVEGEELLVLYPHNDYADSVALRPVEKPEG